jgi:hypothetical protein
MPPDLPVSLNSKITQICFDKASNFITEIDIALAPPVVTRP